MRALRTALAIGLVGGLVALAAPGLAASKADPHALVQRGIALYRDASYAEAVASLERAREGRLTPEEEVECTFYLAAGYVALGSADAARRELRALLEAQPGYELPQYTSPKVAELFREVKDELARRPRLAALPPLRPSPERIELVFAPSLMGGVAYGAARWRWHGEADYREAPLGHHRGQLVAEIAVSRGGTLEYWAEARGPAGLAQAASAGRPLELPVQAAPSAPAQAVLPPSAPPPRKKQPLVRAWWLWTTVGAVAAAGAGVGLYYALRPAGNTADAVLQFQVK